MVKCAIVDEGWLIFGVIRIGSNMIIISIIKGILIGILRCIKFVITVPIVGILAFSALAINISEDRENLKKVNNLIDRLVSWTVK